MKDVELKSDVHIKLERWGHDPHHFLGLHDFDQKKWIRLWRPEAKAVYVELFGNIQETQKVGDGCFELEVPQHTTHLDYRVFHQNGMLAHDPYAFTPTFGEMDSHLFCRGVHYQIYEVLGGRVATHQGVQGVKFAVWAPCAKQVALVGDFNFWDGRVNLMRSMGGSGVWELFVPGLKEHEKYKFEIRTQNDHIRIKTDPFSYFNEMRPSNASVVFDIEKYQWNDGNWLEKDRNTREKINP